VFRKERRPALPFQMRLAISVRCKGVSGIEEVAIKPRGISSRGFISLCAGIIILVNIAGAGCSSAQTQTVPVARVGVQWEADSRRIPERIRVWGGSEFPGIASNTVTRVPEPANFPQVLICWDTFQVGSKGRGSVASFLLVQPPDVGTGVAIRDDAPFQRPTLCTTGFPAISLVNNWEHNRVMTFFLKGESVPAALSKP